MVVSPANTFCITRKHPAVPYLSGDLSFGNCFIFCNIFNSQDPCAVSREGHEAVRGMWHLWKQ